MTRRSFLTPAAVVLGSAGVPSQRIEPRGGLRLLPGPMQSTMIVGAEWGRFRGLSRKEIIQAKIQSRGDYAAWLARPGSVVVASLHDGRMKGINLPSEIRPSFVLRDDGIVFVLEDIPNRNGRPRTAVIGLDEGGREVESFLSPYEEIAQFSFAGMQPVVWNGERVVVGRDPGKQKARFFREGLYDPFLEQVAPNVVWLLDHYRKEGFRFDWIAEAGSTFSLKGTWFGKRSRGQPYGRSIVGVATNHAGLIWILISDGNPPENGLLVVEFDSWGRAQRELRLTPPVNQAEWGKPGGLLHCRGLLYLPTDKGVFWRYPLNAAA